MTGRGAFDMLAVYRGALRAIGLGVPKKVRAEWVSEWESELWYFAETVQDDPAWRERHRAIVRFCRGAIDDARYVRQASPAAPVRAAGSAMACVGWLGVAAVTAAALAWNLPQVRAAVQSPVYRDATDAVMIAPAGPDGGATVALGTVREWQRRTQHLYTEFAFYAPGTKQVEVAPGETRPLRIALASGNALTLLGARLSFAQAGEGDAEPVLLLSRSAWRESFGGGMEVFGRRVRVGVQRARVGGMVADEVAPAGGRVDGWLLLPPAQVDALPPRTGVYPLGKLASQPQRPAVGGHWTMTVHADKQDADYLCTLLAPLEAGTWKLYLFALFLGLLAVPATTSLSLGEYAARPVNLPWSSTLRRWVFLAVKIACTLPGVYFVGLIAAYAVEFVDPYTPQYIQLVVSFALTLFSLRWALRDQRRRCPVCLGLLTCPARVGEPSRNFLAWNGTELICAGGHGFLHVPEMPTSWFGTQRWLHLDPSWSGLFL